MHELALGFMLLLSQWAAQGGVAPISDLASLAASDPCRAARRISEQGACVRPEDCGAFEGWMRLFGEPRNEPLEPKVVERLRPRSFICPAQPDGTLRAPDGPPRPRAGIAGLHP